MGGTSTPYNAFPYVNYSLFGVGSQGIPYYSMSIGSMSFSLFGAFGNNAFLLFVVSVGGNPGYGQKNPMHGTIPA
jgi:hypothetical protein